MFKEISKNIGKNKIQLTHTHSYHTVTTIQLSRRKKRKGRGTEENVDFQLNAFSIALLQKHESNYVAVAT